MCYDFFNDAVKCIFEVPLRFRKDRLISMQKIIRKQKINKYFVKKFVIWWISELVVWCHEQDSKGSSDSFTNFKFRIYDFLMKIFFNWQFDKKKCFVFNCSKLEKNRGQIGEKIWWIRYLCARKTWRHNYLFEKTPQQHSCWLWKYWWAHQIVSRI